jgi:hypothetical protein
MPSLRITVRREATKKKHLYGYMFTVLLENEPGALSRVVSAFQRVATTSKALTQLSDGRDSQFVSYDHSDERF